LAQDQADAAGRRVNQDRVAVLHRIDGPQQHPRSHALQHHRRRLVEGNLVRQLHQPVGLDQPLLGIAAERPRISDPVAGLQVRDALADALDRACALDSGRERHLLRVETGAVIDVDEVEARRSLVDLDLVRSRLADVDFVPDERFGPAGRMDSDRMWHSARLRLRRTQRKAPPRQCRAGLPLCCDEPL
jgi:hypothetical protein